MVIKNLEKLIYLKVLINNTFVKHHFYLKTKRWDVEINLFSIIVL